jgi:microsomal dipeptidase-like Zn-dependent dipeptidase
MIQSKLPLVGSHLDLAENVTLFGRDLTSSLDAIRKLEQRTNNQVMATLSELEPRWRNDKTIPVTLEEHVRKHTDYVANLSSCNHLGIGSDLGGGFGLEESPLELGSIADLYKVGDVIPTEVKELVSSTNWLTF